MAKKGGARPGAGRPKNGPRFGKWTKVEDGYPQQQGEMVLVWYGNDEAYGAEWASGYSTNGQRLSEHVTHWMPLPPPPEQS